MIDQKFYQRTVCQIVNHVIELCRHPFVSVILLQPGGADYRNQRSHTLLVFFQYQQFLVFLYKPFDTVKIGRIELIILIPRAPRVIQRIIFQHRVSRKFYPVTLHLLESLVKLHRIQIINLFCHMLLQLLQKLFPIQLVLEGLIPRFQTVQINCFGSPGALETRISFRMVTVHINDQ